MENWRKDGRKDAMIVEMDALVLKNHLLRKVERVMDYEWLYERLEPYYCADNGRPGTDPVVLIKMVLLQHLYGIPSLRQTHQRIMDTISYRWFLGYNLLEDIPHFSTVSYAFCKRFPSELSEEIFAHILNKMINHRLVDPTEVYIDGTHIKASANKKKFQKEQVAKAAKIYTEQLREEVNAERASLGKKPIEDDEDDDDKNSGFGGGTTERTVSTTDPESGLFIKGEHERQFAYEAHTACDKNGVILGVNVTAGNVHDSVAWDSLYDEVTERLPDIKFVMMDAAYKTAWISKKILDDGRIPILPYTRYHGKKENFRPWDYQYDELLDVFTCPCGETLRHTTTDREGKRIYRSKAKVCRECPCRELCGINKAGQKILQTHIWQEYLNLVEQLRKTELGKELYAKRKETIERAFADAKEKHGMRYTHHRGLARVTNWVKLKYAAMNLKKLATWSWKAPTFQHICSLFFPFINRTPILLR